MGARAQYVVVTADSYELYFDKWGATGVPDDVFTGPSAALASIRSRERVDDWMDDGWCEGGVLIDPGRQILLLFGGEELRFDPMLRRAFMNRITKHWAMWEVRWAYEGIVDLARHVGVSIERVLSPDNTGQPRPSYRPVWACPHSAAATIVSVVPHGDGSTSPPSESSMGVYALHPWIRDLVPCGPKAVLDTCRQLEAEGRNAARLVCTDSGRVSPPRSEFDAATRTLVCRGLWPSGGLHVDVERRNVRYWTSADSTIRYWAPRWWPGWTFESMDDRFEIHEELTQGRLMIETTS